MAPTPITIQTAAPSGRFPGAVANAFFIVENNHVVLTEHALHDPEGRDYTRELGESDNPARLPANYCEGFAPKSAAIVSPALRPVRSTMGRRRNISISLFASV
jgi:hypothetical protein